MKPHRVEMQIAGTVAYQSCGGSGPGEVFHRVRETRPERHGQAALSGSKTKAPGSAGGYLLST
jgi:hypothetical protein